MKNSNIKGWGMLMEWSEKDKVSQKEIDRNAGVSVETKPLQSDDWYNLKGQSVGKKKPAKKGVYIHHGKKVVVE